MGESLERGVGEGGGAEIEEVEGGRAGDKGGEGSEEGVGGGGRAGEDVVPRAQVGGGVALAQVQVRERGVPGQSLQQGDDARVCEAARGEAQAHQGAVMREASAAGGGARPVVIVVVVVADVAERQDTTRAERVAAQVEGLEPTGGGAEVGGDGADAVGVEVEVFEGERAVGVCGGGLFGKEKEQLADRIIA